MPALQLRSEPMSRSPSSATDVVIDEPARRSAMSSGTTAMSAQTTSNRSAISAETIAKRSTIHVDAAAST
ncbi:MAG TPA: hypothetical protein VK601_19410 [Kofleriaceae bacterium]|nr:hypothetical protein [Kofleriaceae bacterium]